MTAIRAARIVLLAILFPLTLSAAPPSDLVGKFVSLNGDRIEFTDSSSGTNGLESVTYTYAVEDTSTATLVVSYPAAARRRDITLGFFADGAPDGFLEFSYDLSGPPLPPRPIYGDFELGDLEVEIPVIESSAPDSLTGKYIQVGYDRVEFLTATEGRNFKQGDADYFSYTYAHVGELSAEAVLTYADGEQTTQLLLEFRENGRPVRYTATEGEDTSLTGRLRIRTNRHLGDLMIGHSEADEVGDDYFRNYGFGQSIFSRLNSTGMESYPFALENDGDVDSFTLRGKRSRRKFDVNYFTRESRSNITAAMVLGTYQTEALEHREKANFVMEVTPTGRNGFFSAWVKVDSLADPRARDRVKVWGLIRLETQGGDVPQPF